jgi:ligand-binding sensor domain-containing protein
MTRYTIMQIAALALILGFPGCKNEVLPPAPPGPSWVTFTQDNSPLIYNKINTINLDGEGRIWFGTDSGACAYRQGVWTAIKDSLTYYEQGQSGMIARKIVTAIAESKDGSIWFGLYGGGVRRFSRFSSARTWQTYHGPTSITYDAVTSVAGVDDYEGHVWVGTVYGLARYTPGLQDPTLGDWDTAYSVYLPSAMIRSLAPDPYNNFVIVGTQQGASYYDNDKNSWGTIRDPDVSPVIAIACDITNTVWMGKWTGLASFAFGSGDVKNYDLSNTNNQLPPGYVNAVAADPFSKTRWFGTFQGLTRLADTTWTLFNRANTPAIPSDSITSLIFDKKGNLWIGTAKGVAVYNGNGTQF